MTVTDADLEKALEGGEPEAPEVPEEVPEETPETPEEPEVPETPEEKPEVPDEPEEPEDNRERSKLGRKVKLLEDQLEETRKLLERAVKEPKEEEKPNPDDLVTVAELEKIIERRDAKKEQERSEYRTKFTRKMGELGLDIDDENDFYAIADDVNKNYKQRSKDPELDATLNFYEAQVRFFKGKVNKVASNPLEKNRGKDVKLPTPSETRVTPRQAKPVKLDPVAESFVKYHGMTPEQVQAALEG